jgi:hypothetical protein
MMMTGARASSPPAEGSAGFSRRGGCRLKIGFGFHETPDKIENQAIAPISANSGSLK